MSFKWPDQNGNPVNLPSLSNEQLVEDTQNLVDSYRRFYDDALRQLVECNTFTIDECYKNKGPMVFTGRLLAMVDECTRRGLPINTDR